MFSKYQGGNLGEMWKMREKKCIDCYLEHSLPWCPLEVTMSPARVANGWNVPFTYASVNVHTLNAAQRRSGS